MRTIACASALPPRAFRPLALTAVCAHHSAEREVTEDKVDVCRDMLAERGSGTSESGLLPSCHRAAHREVVQRTRCASHTPGKVGGWVPWVGAVLWVVRPLSARERVPERGVVGMLPRSYPGRSAPLHGCSAAWRSTVPSSVAVPRRSVDAVCLRSGERLLQCNNPLPPERQLLPDDARHVDGPCGLQAARLSQRRAQGAACRPEGPRLDLGEASTRRVAHRGL